ncbi:putative N6-adenine-specific DNA methylase [Pullulanibacillus pueri]|uniref:Putative RNA methyltransferase YpsC n=1 Tax=Pullulanibacillus pueri TaxID=1437324 RepID=A0A8J2ZYM7_9BACL|nr:class I SAM-dependent RNA methyltransferase [Pullulanibacillus pueri]MBM7680996.1 putative N6-adenine-specific DNA methylase [Pullulanibacillus pueri]GGH86249.1 putative RNA methyltransferase YpsC [Pullulanibacillus pueri]
MSLELIATTAMGIEAIAADELKALGYKDLTVENGRITFKGEPYDICRTNLWLRTADRVKIKVGAFKATTFEELFEKVKALPWAEYLPVNAEFPVSGKSVKSKLFSVSDCQAITKKAIVESLKQHYNQDWFDEDGPKYKLEVSLLKDIATLTIDTTGPGLHKRGYRYLHSGAPLKETLAAAMIYLTRWTPDRPFVDPFCGSGTLPIEAAMIGQNIAPGFNRDFISEEWPLFQNDEWERARAEADEKANYDQPLTIFGSDIDHKMVELSKNNAMEAGFGDLIQFKQMQVTDFTTNQENGVMVGNPPYGERLGEKREVEEMYRKMGEVFKKYDTWSFYFITSNENFEKLYGRKATKKRKLFNGMIRTDYYQFWGKKRDRGTGTLSHSDMG